jgi:hypothetical protein
MRKLAGTALAGLCIVGAMSLALTSATAQTAETKEKPAIYTYVSNWAIPRGKWADMDKDTASTNKALEHALASGTIIAYGDDINLVHTSEGATHDGWWSATSMAGVLDVLAGFYSSGSAESPVLQSATKHWDDIFVSHYYNWRSGNYKGAYTHAGVYRLKAGAPDDAVEMLSKSVIVPLCEKLLAEGALVEYEVDEQAVHTDPPGLFAIVYITPNSAGLDRVDAALHEFLRSNPTAGPAFSSMVDYGPHRDYLYRTNAIYK